LAIPRPFVDECSFFTSPFFKADCTNHRGTPQLPLEDPFQPLSPYLEYKRGPFSFLQRDVITLTFDQLFDAFEVLLLGFHCGR